MHTPVDAHPESQTSGLSPSAGTRACVRACTKHTFAVLRSWDIHNIERLRRRRRRRLVHIYNLNANAAARADRRVLRFAFE